MQGDIFGFFLGLPSEGCSLTVAMHTVVVADRLAVHLIDLVHFGSARGRRCTGWTRRVVQKHVSDRLGICGESA